MTLQLSPPQQRFFNAVVTGKTYAEAYKLAGFKGSAKAEGEAARKLGSAVANSARMADALARARAQAADRLGLVTDDIVAMLLEARDIALKSDPPQANAAVAAAMGIAKLLGLVIDRSELNVVRNKPSLFPTSQLELSEEEWKRQFDTATSNHT